MYAEGREIRRESGTACVRRPHLAIEYTAGQVSYGEIRWSQASRERELKAGRQRARILLVFRGGLARPAILGTRLILVWRPARIASERRNSGVQWSGDWIRARREDRRAEREHGSREDVSIAHMRERRLYDRAAKSSCHSTLGLASGHTMRMLACHRNCTHYRRCRLEVPPQLSHGRTNRRHSMSGAGSGYLPGEVHHRLVKAATHCRA